MNSNPSDKQQIQYTRERPPVKVVAPKKTPTLKVGERWVPKSGNPGGFTVLEVTAGEIVVEVERRVPKDGEIKIEQRRRSVTRNDVVFFVSGYKKAPK